MHFHFCALDLSTQCEKIYDILNQYFMQLFADDLYYCPKHAFSHFLLNIFSCFLSPRCIFDFCHYYRFMTTLNYHVLQLYIIQYIVDTVYSSTIVVLYRSIFMYWHIIYHLPTLKLLCNSTFILCLGNLEYRNILLCTAV